MSALLPNHEIKQELLDTLDKLIRHSQDEAQFLKVALDSLNENPAKTEHGELVVKEEVLDVDDATITDPVMSSNVPTITPLHPSPSDGTMLAAQTLFRMKEELTKKLHKAKPREEDGDVPRPSAKRPRIELGPEFSLPYTSSVSDPDPSNTPMVLVPIPASKVKELLMNGGTIPPMSLLSALPYAHVAGVPSVLPTTPQPPSVTVHHHPSPPPSSTSSTTSPITTSPTSSPLLSPTISSSILRFCERRSARDAVDVFHYLPADAKASPFPTTKSNYRQFLDDITAAKVKIPKLPKSYEALPKLSPVMNERTVYTPFQTERLEQSFTSNPFLTKEQREELSKVLNIHPGRIKVWYQNRRARKRREELLKEKIETAARTGSTTVTID